MNYIEAIEAYEQEHGHKPDELAMLVAEHISKVGEILTEFGRKDAQEGKSAYPADAFPPMVVKVFRMDAGEDHETVQVVADLWRDAYMDGYNAGIGG